MKKDLFEYRPFRLKQVVVRLFQVAALALAVTLAMHAGAEDRAVVSRVAPIYPDLARRMNVSGAVKIEATVDAGGKVTNVKAVAGSALLAPAAEDAVRRWRFAPGAGTAKVDVEVNFTKAG
jgi:TonB family protein